MFDLGFNFIKTIKRNLFPFYKNKELKFVFKTLKQGFSDEIVVARFVGGCVRKYLTNNIIDDIDIATILSTDQIKERFRNTNVRVIDTGIKHGTVTLVSDQLKLEQLVMWLLTIHLHFQRWQQIRQQQHKQYYITKQQAVEEQDCTLEILQ